MSAVSCSWLLLSSTLHQIVFSLPHSSLNLGADSRSSPLLLLQQNLLSSYSKEVLPSNAGSPPSVFIGLAPQWMELQENGVLSLTAWLRLAWTDKRLKWTPEEHHNITSFRISPTHLWKPDILILNKQDVSYGGQAVDPRSVDASKVHVESSGDIIWLVPVNHKVLCEQVDYVTWPWGKQTCNVRFGTYSQDFNAFDLQFYNRKNKMNLRHYGKNNQFKILRQRGVRKLTKSKQSETNQFVSLNYMFSLQRSYRVDPDKGRIENPTPSEQRQFESMLRKVGRR